MHPDFQPDEAATAKPLPSYGRSRILFLATRCGHWKRL